MARVKEVTIKITAETVVILLKKVAGPREPKTDPEEPPPKVAPKPPPLLA
jgi:hypothetical protein